MKFNGAYLFVDDEQHSLRLGKKDFFETLYTDFAFEKTDTFDRLVLQLHPKRDVQLQALYLEYDFPFKSGDRIFCNGFQSWTESREYELNERLPHLRPIAKRWLGMAGDYHIDLPKGTGLFHSWTMAYVRRGQQYFFIGSLNEASGFSWIELDTQAHKIRFHLDAKGLLLTHSFPAIDLIQITTTDSKSLWDLYFQQYGCAPIPRQQLKGWTSWYHYYTDITESIIFDNLKAFQDRQIELDIFQIDDGYQTAVGDWLSIKADFPNGMAPIAKRIKSAGYRPGLWLAPFICSQQSKLFKEHPNWILKDEKGQALKVGYNPLWKGWFYALDFYHTEVQTYLAGVFHTVIHKWGFELLKLDFLYAVCLLPRKNKTRGQVMDAAMQLLRQLAGDTPLLGCGVPLGSAFGVVDYCRIGADIHLKWEHGLLKWAGHRERVSTLLSLRNTLNRWPFDHRAFLNDPDVFLLRKEKNQLTPDQQYTILLVNSLLGSVLFTSDYVNDYDELQWAEYEQALKWAEAEVREVKLYAQDVFLIYFVLDEIAFMAAVNLQVKEVMISQGKTQVKLLPFESMVLQDRI